MKRLIERLKTSLQYHVNSDVLISTIQEGVYLLTSSSLKFDIYLYEDTVKSRLQISSDKRHIHIDQDILSQNFEKTIQRLLTIAGFGKRIYARDTVVARIDKKVTLAFQEEHHLQAALPGKYRYGLFYHGELMSIAIFSGGRRMNEKHDDYRSFELLRFCHKSGFIVIGGLSKLIHCFAKDFHPNDIMTYVDLDWSQQSTLSVIGFKAEKSIPPQTYLLTKNGRLPFRELHTDSTGLVKENNGSTKMVLYYLDIV